MRGDNMTSPKIMNIGGKILKPNIGFYSEFFAILFELGKICIFQNCILGPNKCSPCPAYF